MTNCQLIFCEKASRCAPVVRRELANKAVRIVETRSLAGCEAAIAESPESLVVIEATASNLTSVVDFLVRLRDSFPQAAAVTVPVVDSATYDSVKLELLLAEAGAIGVFRSLLDAPAIARMAERKFQASPASDVSLQEFVAARLPWPTHTTP